MEQRRIFSASDLAQFEYCPLAWWYEEVSDLAQADEDELSKRLAEVEAQYPASASARPDYQVIERLLERAQRFASGREQHAADAAQHQPDQANDTVAHTGNTAGDASVITAPVPRAFAAVVVGLVVLVVVLIGLGLLLWMH